MPAAVAQVLDVFRAEIGQTEQPRGSNVSKYGLWFGMSVGPWCSCFVCWAFNAAGAVELVATVRNRRGSAYSGDLYEDAKAEGRLVASAAARPGDLVCWNWPNAGTYSDHVGIIEVVYANGTWGTIEGNSVGVGQVSDSVGRHVRRAGASVLGVLRPAYAGAPVPGKPMVIAPHPNPTPWRPPMFVANTPGEFHAAYCVDGELQSKWWLKTPRAIDLALQRAEPRTVVAYERSFLDMIPLVGTVPEGYTGVRA